MCLDTWGSLGAGLRGVEGRSGSSARRSGRALCRVLTPCCLSTGRDNFGFLTYRYACDAFAALERGHTLRRPDEPQFELCFGGQKQFCGSHYADLGERTPPAGSAFRRRVG